MKKYFVIAVAALAAMSSCTKSELATTAVTDEEIAFQVANYVGQTKANDDCDPSHSSYYADGHFGTFAWQLAKDKSWSTSSTEGQTTFMDNVDIYCQNSVWKAQASYFWPKTGSVTFASYSPYLAKSQTAGATQAAVNATTGAITISNWAVEPDLSAQLHSDNDATNDYKEDLMWADIAADKTANNTTHFTSGVPTLFHHALAKVTLKAQVKQTPENSAYNYKVIINNIAVASLLYKGTYTVGATTPWAPTTDRKGDDAIFNQTYDAPGVGTVYADPVGKKVLSTTAGTYFADYFVLPQTLAATSTIKINYTIFTLDKITGKVVLVETLDSYKLVEDAAGDIVVDDKKYKKVDIKISDMGLTEWKENQDITYTVTLVPTGGSGPNPEFVEIYFDPAVTPWSTEGATGSVTL